MDTAKIRDANAFLLQKMYFIASVTVSPIQLSYHKQS